MKGYDLNKETFVLKSERDVFHLRYAVKGLLILSTTKTVHDEKMFNSSSILAFFTTGWYMNETFF